MSIPSLGRRVGGRLAAMRWPRAVEERFVALPRSRSAEQRKYFVVCGDDALAYRVVGELSRTYKANVAVILPSRHRNYGPQIARYPGVRVIEANRLDAEVFRAARVHLADAVALVEQNDVGNIHAALIAQDLKPRLRVVLRVFNTSLGYRVKLQIPNSTVLSDAAMASPAFVSAALGEVELTHVRLPGRTLFVATRDEVQPHQVICGLAVTSPSTDAAAAEPPTAGSPGLQAQPTTAEDEPEVLPADPGRAELVLAVADGAGPASLVWNGDGDGRGRRRWLPYHWRLPAVGEALRALMNRKLWLAFAALNVLLGLGTVALASIRGFKPWDAAYAVLLTAVGGAEAGDPETLGGWEQVTMVVITLAGIALVPVITAAIVEALLKARLAVALGRLRQPVADHVVVIGLGNVGTRVIRALHEFGVPVVAIDRLSTARGADLARRLGIPLVVGDASQEAVLRAAYVHTCRALVVLSTDDNVNLEATLSGRALKADLRVVLRLFSGDFARRVQRAFGVAISHSVSYVAAPAFAAAMMEHDVLATIPVGRRVLLIAEVAVAAGSRFAGGTVAAANVPGKSWLIAVYAGPDAPATWSPPGRHPIRANDRLIVVATRAGLARVVEASTPATEFTPA